jgi:hypothetical protein
MKKAEEKEAELYLGVLAEVPAAMMAHGMGLAHRAWRRYMILKCGGLENFYKVMRRMYGPDWIDYDS